MIDLRFLYVCCTAMVAGLLFFAGAPLCRAGTEPFQVGEKITYQLKWSGVPAGQVILEVLPHTTIDNRPARHFRMTTRSNSFIDAFYKVRGVVDGFTDPDLHHSLQYRKKQREGSSDRDIVVSFDPEKETAQYHNLRKSGARSPIATPVGTFDPFSVIYYCRLLDYDGLQTVERPISDGKKSVLGRVDNRGRQTLIIGDNSYETFLLEPDIKDVSGVFKKSDDANILIWLSDDGRRLPVKLQSKVIIGSFTAEMISYQAK